MEVHNTVQEAVTKTISKKKKYKKAKWLSEQALQIAEKRKVNGKGERERHTQLNAEFQRTARREKKAFFKKKERKKPLLSEQCKEIEESNRVGKTRDLQENWRYQGNISCKDGLNKGQKHQGPNKSRRDEEEVARIYRAI